MRETHSTPYVAYPGSTKIYQDFQHNFLWNRMQKDTAEFVQQYQVFQQVKAKRMKPPGLPNSSPIPEWKWEHIMMGFVTGLRRHQKDLIQYGY